MWPMEAGRGRGSTGAGVPGGWEPPDVLTKLGPSVRVAQALHC